MPLRLPEGPVLDSFETAIPAETYNPIRLRLLRERRPVELLLGARGLHLHLAPETWLVSDRNLDHRPLLAWTAFRNGRRCGPHHAVSCSLVYYHAYASVVVNLVLPEVAERLGTGHSSRSAAVLPFPAGCPDYSIK